MEATAYRKWGFATPVAAVQFSIQALPAGRYDRGQGIRRTAAEMIMRNVIQDFTDSIRAGIAINDLLQVQLTEDQNSATHHSRINDISEGKLIIAWPTHGGMRLIVHRDQILLFHFLRDDVPHEFTGLVDEMNATGIPQLTIIPSSPITRIQRRQNFRIKCMLPVEITGSWTNPPNESVPSSSIRTTTTDLSASGISIRYSKLIPENSLVEVKLALPDNAPAIRIPCRVVYSDSPAESQLLYRTGLRFLAISESERARIVRHVYRSQLKGLRP
jgi:c-di-GMP-binding flagellar brake protein YcgR